MIKHYTILYSLLFSMIFSITLSADNLNDSHAIFAWAEKSYPQYFPVNEFTETFDSIEYQSINYIARHYMPADSYIGTSNGMVYIFSEALFDGLLEVNTMGKFLDIIAADNDKARINDSGAESCSSNVQNNLSCPSLSDFPGQDAEFGRDFSNNESSDGIAGFSFTKLDELGNALPADANTWTCVKDNVTTLIWEVKPDDQRLRDKDWFYSWFDTSTVPATGINNGGFCFGSQNCDTENYVRLVNEEELCGASNWRLPSSKELTSLINFQRYGFAIDRDYFPNTINQHYWSSQSKIGTSANAWYIHFYNGELNHGIKTNGKYVRLVRTE